MYRSKPYNNVILNKILCVVSADALFRALENKEMPLHCDGYIKCLPKVFRELPGTIFINSYISKVVCSCETF